MEHEANIHDGCSSSRGDIPGFYIDSGPTEVFGARQVNYTVQYSCLVFSSVERQPKPTYHIIIGINQPLA
jgi:hypothetical protein